MTSSDARKAWESGIFVGNSPESLVKSINIPTIFEACIRIFSEVVEENYTIEAS